MDSSKLLIMNPLKKNAYKRIEKLQLKDLGDKVNEIVEKMNKDNPMQTEPCDKCYECKKIDCECPPTPSKESGDIIKILQEKIDRNDNPVLKPGLMYAITVIELNVSK